MSILKNSTLNVLGLVIPSLIAVPVMGVMARMLGIEKFGIFTLAFAVLGYAGIFDAGLTRAVIRSVAIHRGDVSKNRQLIGTASYAVAVLGVIATILLWSKAYVLVKFFNISNGSFQESVDGFKWLSLTIIPFLLTMIWFSYLEGNERFAELNVLKTITSTFIAITPLFAVLIHKSLGAAIFGLLVGRIIAMFVAYIPCHRGLPGGIMAYDGKTLKDLFQFGSWITISNVISPIMVYFDRFILSNIIGAHTVAFYTAPAEAVSRMSVVPGAVAKSLFPAFSKRPNDSKAEISTAFWGLLAVCSIMVLPMFIFADLIMTTWMGTAFKGEAAAVLRILLIGFMFNSLAQVPFSKIHARGHSRITAIVHLAEIIPYVTMLLFFVQRYALKGAAVVWTVRVIVDYILMEIISRKV